MDQRLAYYIDRYTTGKMTAQERQALVVMLKDPAHRALLQEAMDEVWEDLKDHDLDFGDLTDRVEENVLGRIETASTHVTPRPVHRVHFLKTAWFRYAAALVIIATGIALYYTFSRSSDRAPDTSPAGAVAKADIQPGYSHAVLTLSDGRKLALDSAASETIRDGKVAIENTEGHLVYAKGDVVATNTMTTPRGGQYQLTLADGTKVWLNAASSITYPTAFTGKERKVTITGEAYLEVTHDASKPFLVDVDGKSMVQVLGTSFNVNAYDDEPATRTTLLEGSIRFTQGNDSLVLWPGQQVRAGSSLELNKGVDVQQVIAWKNGVFNFTHAPFDEFMRQLSRWYDIEIVYEGAIPQKIFVGELGRNLALSQILKVLSLYEVPYELKGKALVIR